MLADFNSKFGTNIVDDGIESNILSRIVSEIENRQSSLLKEAENKLNADGFGFEANAIFDAFRKQEQQSEETAQVVEQATNEIVEANQRQEQSSSSTTSSVIADKKKEKSAKVKRIIKRILQLIIPFLFYPFLMLFALIISPLFPNPDLGAIVPAAGLILFVFFANTTGTPKCCATMHAIPIPDASMVRILFMFFPSKRFFHSLPISLNNSISI